MNNTAIFNQLTFDLLVKLEDSFPVPFLLRPSDFLGQRPESLHRLDSDGEEVEQTNKEETFEWARKRDVLEGTLQFLLAEKFIRIVDRSDWDKDEVDLPADKKIQIALSGGKRSLLFFVLTAHGLTQIRKKIDDGQLVSETIIQRMKMFVAGGLKTKAAEIAMEESLKLISVLFSTAVVQKIF